MDTPASPINGEIVCTIFLYSSSSARFESLCPDAISSLMCGFLAIKDGLVVCPSTNPNSSLARRVSCGSPPSTNIFVLGRFIGMLLSVAYAHSAISSHRPGMMDLSCRYQRRAGAPHHVEYFSACLSVIRKGSDLGAREN